MVMNNKKSAKRIVSRAAYVKSHGQIVIMATVGAIIYTVATALGFVALALLLTGIGLIPYAFPIGCLTLISAGIVGLGTYYTFKVGNRIFQSVYQIDPGVPFTRSNTAHLPAQESLVRASYEPFQEQQYILLRPALQNDTTPPEQLVRPADADDQVEQQY